MAETTPDTAGTGASMPAKRKRRYKPGETVKMLMGATVANVQVVEDRGVFGPQGERILRVSHAAGIGACEPPTSFEVFEASVW